MRLARTEGFVHSYLPFSSCALSSNDSSTRWISAALSRVFAAALLGTVLHPGCSTAMMLGARLARTAAWCVVRRMGLVRSTLGQQGLQQGPSTRPECMSVVLLLLEGALLLVSQQTIYAFLQPQGDCAQPGSRWTEDGRSPSGQAYCAHHTLLRDLKVMHVSLIPCLCC